jgi:hypothetical protein
VRYAQIAVATRMVFHQTAAPAGWTKDTTANLNDTALRVTTGTVGSRTAGKAFTTLLATAKAVSTGGTTVTGSTAATVDSTNLNLAVANTNLNLAVAGHALTESEMPAHRHQSFINAAGTAGTTHDLSSLLSPAVTMTAEGNLNYVMKRSATGGDATIGRTSQEGAGAAHDHTLSGTPGNHNHSLTGTATSHGHTSPGHTHSIATHNHTIDLDLNYHDVIICARA